MKFIAFLQELPDSYVDMLTFNLMHPHDREFVPDGLEDKESINWRVPASVVSIAASGDKRVIRTSDAERVIEKFSYLSRLVKHVSIYH